MCKYEFYNLFTDIRREIKAFKEEAKYKEAQKYLCIFLFPQWDGFEEFVKIKRRNTQKDITPTSFLASIFEIDLVIMGKILNQLDVYKGYKKHEGVGIIDDCCNVVLRLK